MGKKPQAEISESEDSDSSGVSSSAPSKPTQKNRSNEDDDSSSSNEGPSQTSQKRRKSISSSSKRNNSSSSSSDSDSSSSSSSSPSINRSNNSETETPQEVQPRPIIDPLKKFLAQKPLIREVKVPDIITNDEDIYSIQVPKSIDPQVFLNEKLKLKRKTKLKIGGSKYVIRPNQDTAKILLLTSQLQFCKPLANFQVQKHIKEIDKGEIVGSVPARVSLPDNLKVRHPLFGHEFKTQIILDETVEKKLSEAIDWKLAAQSESKKKKKKKPKNEEQEIEETIFSFMQDNKIQPPADSLPVKEKKKKKRTIKEEVFTDTEDVAFETASENNKSSGLMSPKAKKRKNKPSESDASEFNQAETIEEETPPKKKKKKKKIETEAEVGLPKLHEVFKHSRIQGTEVELSSPYDDTENEAMSSKQKMKKKKKIKAEAEDGLPKFDEFEHNRIHETDVELSSQYDETENEAISTKQKRKKKKKVKAEAEEGLPNEEFKHNRIHETDVELSSQYDETENEAISSKQKRKKKKKNMESETADVLPKSSDLVTQETSEISRQLNDSEPQKKKNKKKSIKAEYMSEAEDILPKPNAVFKHNRIHETDVELSSQDEGKSEATQKKKKSKKKSLKAEYMSEAEDILAKPSSTSAPNKDEQSKIQTNIEKKPVVKKERRKSIINSTTIADMNPPRFDLDLSRISPSRQVVKNSSTGAETLAKKIKKEKLDSFDEASEASSTEKRKKSKKKSQQQDESSKLIEELLKKVKNEMDASGHKKIKRKNDASEKM